MQPASASDSPAARPAAASPAAAPPAAAEVRSFADMHVRVGDRAQLEPPHQTNVGRVPVRIVGWIDSHSLITTVPETRVGRLTLRKGEIVLLRVFTGSSAYAFKCSVLKDTRPPFEYLHLSFPDRIEALEVRKSSRYRVDFPANAVPAGRKEPVEVLIEDISATGALIRSTEPLGSTGEGIRLDVGFELHGIPVRLSLSPTLRSIKSGEGPGGVPIHRQGTDFGTVAPNDQLLLHALVWYEMHAHPRNAV